jgi:ribosomal protein S18 acetylase RimI-like enzyme
MTSAIKFTPFQKGVNFILQHLLHNLAVMKETVALKNNSTINIRELQKNDEEQLFNYFSQLSTATRSRFGPHLFDRETVQHICSETSDDISRYIALSEQQEIIAYLLIKIGMNEGEKYRLGQNNIAFDEPIFCTFAPSVADAWQSSGLGSAMYGEIENDIRNNTPFRFIILWGGVQARNARAIGFYKKQGFKQIGSFWYDGKDNYDMIKSLY